MSTTLTSGDPAPAFRAEDQEGKTHNLEDYKGKRLVLYFYPKDDTPGCTKEACNLRDHFQQLQASGYQVLGVSPDDTASHQKFAQKLSLPFPLLADPDRTIINAYGVYGEKNMFGKKVMSVFRTTFLINEDGLIDRVIKKVKTDDHTRQILDS